MNHKLMPAQGHIAERPEWTWKHQRALRDPARADRVHVALMQVVVYLDAMCGDPPLCEDVVLLPQSERLAETALALLDALGTVDLHGPTCREFWEGVLGR